MIAGEPSIAVRFIASHREFQLRMGHAPAALKVLLGWRHHRVCRNVWQEAFLPSSFHCVTQSLHPWQDFGIHLAGVKKGSVTNFCRHVHDS